MDALAAEAFLNADHKVCGLRMRPLSLGHAFALEAIASPFYKGQLGSMQELRLAAWICSRPALTLPNIGGWRCRLWKLRKFDFAAELQRWKVYVADFCAPPQVWNKKSGSKAKSESSRIPGPVQTAVRLMRLGMTEAQAWATPVGKAAWYEAAAFECENGATLDIVTDAERAAIVRHQKRKGAKNG